MSAHGTEVREIIDRGRYLHPSHLICEGEGRRPYVIAILTILFSPIAAFFHTINSARQVTLYQRKLLGALHREQGARGNDQKIYRNTVIILRELTATKVENTATQFVTGTGLLLLTIAILVAVISHGQIPQIGSMLRYGVTLTALGFGSYLGAQIYYHAVRRPRIERAYDALGGLVRSTPDGMLAIPAGSLATVPEGTGSGRGSGDKGDQALRTDVTPPPSGGAPVAVPTVTVTATAVGPALEVSAPAGPAAASGAPVAVPTVTVTAAAPAPGAAGGSGRNSAEPGLRVSPSPAAPAAGAAASGSRSSVPGGPTPAPATRPGSRSTDSPVVVNAADGRATPGDQPGLPVKKWYQFWK